MIWLFYNAVATFIQAPAVLLLTNQMLIAVFSWLNHARSEIHFRMVDSCAIWDKFAYRIAENFREAEIFAIFMIKHQLAKICSHENFFLLNVLADELSTVPSSRRTSKLSESWLILSSKHQANCGNFLRPTINSQNCEYILGVSSLRLAWQFFTDSDRHILISMEILLSLWRWKCMLWVTISMWEIVGGGVRHCDLVVKKIAKFFSGMLVIRENLCLQKFYTIRYHFEQNNWSTYSYSLSHYSNKCHSTSSLITQFLEWPQWFRHVRPDPFPHEIETGNS